MSECQYSNDKTVKVPVLNERKFGLFQSKFKSVAAIKGFTEALEPGFAPKLPAEENDVLTSSEEDKEKQRFKTMNSVAVHYLTLSFEQGEHLNFVEDARTADWPSGLACKIWKNIENEFQPSNVLAETEMSKKLMGLTLAKREDPRKLGKRTAIIQSGFKIKVEEKEKISAIVNSGGIRYADAIGQVQRFCEMKSKPVTARKLIKAMHENFRLRGGESCLAREEENARAETILSMAQAKKCYNCGEIGRMANKCQHKKMVLVDMDRVILEMAHSRAITVVELVTN